MRHTVSKRSAPPLATSKRVLAPDRPPPLEGRLTFRVREVIELTGLSQSTIYEMMDDGSLASTKVRGIRLIYADSLRNVLALSAP
jgi:excisionase family DNA binding protein